MAFELRHWLIAVLAACTLVAIAYLPPEPNEYASDDRVWYLAADRRVRLRDYLRMTRARLYQIELRDSLVARVSQESGRFQTGPLLLIDPGLPAAIRDSIRAVSERPLARLQSTPAMYRLVVAIGARDPAGPWSGPGGVRYLLPEATGGGTCIVSLGLRRDLSEEDLLRSLSFVARRYAVLGPCAFYVAFGPPGSQIEAWLEATDHMPARSTGWTVDASPIGPLQHEERQFRAWRRLGLYACASGSRYNCRAGVLDPEALYRYRGWSLASDRQREPGILTPRYPSYSLLFGTSTDRWLSDLLVDMGRERFAAFWTSRAAVDSAFVEAFGVDLEDWTMHWARAQVGHFDAGPAPSASTAGSGLLVAGLLVAGGVLLFTRRQVG